MDLDSSDLLSLACVDKEVFVSNGSHSDVHVLGSVVVAA
jgi:hypothetical protein